MFQETTLALSAGGYTKQIALQGKRRVAVKITAGNGDAAGNFHIVTRASPNAGWDRHATHTVAKSAGVALSKRFEYADVTGHELAVEWDRSSGGTDQTASIYVSAH